MARPRQTRKLRSSLSKVRQKPRSKARLRNPQGDSIVAANWDNAATMSQNYRRLGLAVKLNARAGGTQKRLGPSNKDAVEEPMLIRPQQPTQKPRNEVRVERDPESGAIVRVISDEREEDNPLNDPIRELDTDSEVDGEAPSGDHDELRKDTDVVSQLRDQAGRAAPTRLRQQSLREREWVGRLVEKHGEDCRRMATDRKLNPMQQTESDIRRRVEIWKENGR